MKNRTFERSIPVHRLSMFVLSILMGLLLGVLVGCHSEAVSEPAAAIESEHGHDHHHEEEGHLEHHVPHHRPSDYSSAVDQIARRFGKLAESGTAQLPETQWAELQDIVRWLPEIAADSDMRRSQWEQVDRHAEELAAELKQWALLAPDRRSEVQPRIDKAIDALTELKGTERISDQQEQTNG